MDITGCPTSNFDFKDESNKTLIDDGTLFNNILHYDEQNFCISVSTPGEDLWADTRKDAMLDSGLVAAHSYSII